MKKTVFAFGAIMAIVLGVLIGAKAIPFHSNKENVIENGKKQVKDQKKITSVKTKILFAGTTFWGRRTNQNARASELGVKYPFSQLNTLEPEKYDAWIGGLECPVTNNGHNDQEENTIFKFNCDPDYLVEAKKYFTAFLLGNNHTDNQGVDGFIETKKHLDENGIQYFGSYDYRDGKNNCDVIVLPVEVSYNDKTLKTFQLPFGFCSAHGVYGVPTEDVLLNMKKYAAVLPTIAMPHMGAEYKATLDELRQNLYHKMIDYGVEAVIGDHPHWIQNTEAYKNRLIVYSMGNFMFDQTFNKEVSRSAAIEANVDIDANESDLKKWDKIGKNCLKNKETCMNDIEKAGLSKLQLTWKYDYHGTTSAENRITRLANEQEQIEIGQRLDWTKTSQGMK